MRYFCEKVEKFWRIGFGIAIIDDGVCMMVCFCTYTMLDVLGVLGVVRVLAVVVWVFGEMFAILCELFPFHEKCHSLPGNSIYSFLFDCFMPAILMEKSGNRKDNKMGLLNMEQMEPEYNDNNNNNDEVVGDNDVDNSICSIEGHRCSSEENGRKIQPKTQRRALFTFSNVERKNQQFSFSPIFLYFFCLLRKPAEFCWISAHFSFFYKMIRFPLIFHVELDSLELIYLFCRKSLWWDTIHLYCTIELLIIARSINITHTSHNSHNSCAKWKEKANLNIFE